MTWRPGKTAPKNGSWVLLICDLCGGPAIIAARWDRREKSKGPRGRFAWKPDEGSWIADGVVTHWRPIPKMPKHEWSAD